MDGDAASSSYARRLHAIIESESNARVSDMSAIAIDESVSATTGDAFPSDFADMLSVYERLPYREWRVPGLGGKGLIVLRRCSVTDIVLSLFRPR